MCKSKKSANFSLITQVSLVIGSTLLSSLRKLLSVSGIPLQTNGYVAFPLAFFFLVRPLALEGRSLHCFLMAVFCENFHSRNFVMVCFSFGIAFVQVLLWVLL